MKVLKRFLVKLSSISPCRKLVILTPRRALLLSVLLVGLHCQEHDSTLSINPEIIHFITGQQLRKWIVKKVLVIIISCDYNIRHAVCIK